MFLSVPQFGQPAAQFCQAPLSGLPDEAFVPMVDAAYFPIGMALNRGTHASWNPRLVEKIVARGS